MPRRKTISTTPPMLDGWRLEADKELLSLLEIGAEANERLSLVKADTKPKHKKGKDYLTSIELPVGTYYAGSWTGEPREPLFFRSRLL